MSRPLEGLPGRRVHPRLSYCSQGRRMVVGLETMVERPTRIHISHHTIHGIMKDVVMNQPAKTKQRKWVRHGRRHTNLWYTDHKQLPDGKRFVSFQDDVSRLVGHGVFDEATNDHEIKVLEDAEVRQARSDTHWSWVVVLRK